MRERNGEQNEDNYVISSPQTNYPTAENAIRSFCLYPQSKKIIFHQFKHNQFECENYK